jgi:hypothetical protein
MKRKGKEEIEGKKADHASNVLKEAPVDVNAQEISNPTTKLSDYEDLVTGEEAVDSTVANEAKESLSRPSAVLAPLEKQIVVGHKSSSSRRDGKSSSRSPCRSRSKADEKVSARRDRINAPAIPGAHACDDDEGYESRKSSSHSSGRQPRGNTDAKTAARRARKSTPVIPGAHAYESNELDNKDSSRSSRRGRSKQDEKISPRRARKSTPVLPGAHAYESNELDNNDSYRSSRRGRSKQDEKISPRRARKSTPVLPGAHAYNPNEDRDSDHVSSKTRAERKKGKAAGSAYASNAVNLMTLDEEENMDEDRNVKYAAMQCAVASDRAKGEELVEAMVVAEEEEEIVVEEEENDMALVERRNGKVKQALDDENARIARQREEEDAFIQVRRAERIAKEASKRKKSRLLCGVLFVVIVAAIGAYFGIQTTGTHEPVVVTASSPTDSPTVGETPIPTGSPTDNPTDFLKYDPPTPEECEQIKSGQPRDGQDQIMLMKIFDVFMEVQLSGQTDMGPLMTDIQERIEQVLVPDLAGCFDVESNRQLASKSMRGSRRLESNRFVIANGIVTMAIDEDAACTDGASDNCHVVVVNLELSLQGDERIFALIGIIVDVFVADSLNVGPPIDKITVTSVNSLNRKLDADIPFTMTRLLTSFPPRLLSATTSPSAVPTEIPSISPTALPSARPSTPSPSGTPSMQPSTSPSIVPSAVPSIAPTQSPTCLAASAFFLNGVSANEAGAPETVFTFDCGETTDFAILIADAATCEVRCLASLPFSVISATCQTESRFSFLTGASMQTGAVIMGHVSETSALICDSTLTLVTAEPTTSPTALPTPDPTPAPSTSLSFSPTGPPSPSPTKSPTGPPSPSPTKSPTRQPTPSPTKRPTKPPTSAPSKSPTPPPTQAPTYPVEQEQVITSYQFSVESIENDGRYFWVSPKNFPITINPYENTRYRTSVRVNNLTAPSRNKGKGLKGVMFQYFPATDMVRGHYNPYVYTSVGDFAVGDKLEIQDYEPITNGDCVPEEYGIVAFLNLEQSSSGTGWNVPISNVRIGKFGVIGGWYKDFEYTVYLDTAVTTFWCDAVGIVIDVSTDGGNSFSPVTAPASNPTLRSLGSSVSGYIQIRFYSVSHLTLNGLITSREAGGLHFAFC